MEESSVVLVMLSWCLSFQDSRSNRIVVRRISFAVLARLSLYMKKHLAQTRISRSGIVTILG